MNAARAGRRRARTLLSLLVAGALVVTIAPQALGGEITRRERILSLHNDARAEREREALRLNDRLSRYAKKHSQEMAEKGYIFHSDPEAIVRALGDVDWEIGGENVGVGTSIDSLNSAFMASRSHRRNILRTAFDHAAIGIVRQNGAIWVTVIFYG